MFSLLSIAATGAQRSLELIRRISGADIVVHNGSLRFLGSDVVGTQRNLRLPQTRQPPSLDANVHKIISSIPGVLIASPVLIAKANIISSNGLATVGVYGVDPLSYLEVSPLEVEIGRFLGGLGVYEVVISKSIADELNILAGDNIVLTLGNTSITFKVVGVYRAVNKFAENTIYIPIDIVQNTTGLNNRISQVLIKCVDPSQARDIAQQIMNTITGVAVFIPTAMVQNVSQAISTVTYFFMTIGLVAVTAGVFSVMNTMFMAVVERTREIGIMKAIGASDGFVLRLFLLESIIIGLIGGIICIIFGSALSYTIMPIVSQIGLRGMFNTPGGSGPRYVSLLQLTPTITPLNILTSLALGMAVGIVAGVYPAYRAYKLKPVEAIRHV